MVFDHPPVSAFKAERDPFCRVLKTKITVIMGDQSITVDGIWDTGATGSCISQHVVDTLKPTRLGYRTVFTPSGQSERGVYLLDFVLPNNIRVSDVSVFDSEIGDQGIDVLIGMDIISMGDFAVSNCGGKLVFTFRTPSIKTTDYVAEVNKENIWVNAQTNRRSKKKK